ncbi:MAG: PD40 domain-containing protein [Candidatus Sericytochromatia bacterium]|nr:PD40 domain-containing protein [Candidatus Sericytochromatia bacterium]
MIKRFNQLFLLSVLLFSCGWGPNDFIPTQQQITNLAWSPDGQKLAFMYENDKETNHNISFYRSSLYVINVDGTGLKRVQFNPESSSPYY